MSCYFIKRQGRQSWVRLITGLQILIDFLEIELLNSFNYDVVRLAYSNLSGDSLHSSINKLITLMCRAAAYIVLISRHPMLITEVCIKYQPL
jgi:hypothetical protein